MKLPNESHLQEVVVTVRVQFEETETERQLQQQEEEKEELPPFPVLQKTHRFLEHGGNQGNELRHGVCEVLLPCEGPQKRVHVHPALRVERLHHLIHGEHARQVALFGGAWRLTRWVLVELQMGLSARWQ